MTLKLQSNQVIRWLLNGDPAIRRSSQCADGRWPLQHRYNGKTFFELERVGAPSRCNTLRALRVLNWWQGRRFGSAADTED